MRLTQTDRWQIVNAIKADMPALSDSHIKDLQDLMEKRVRAIAIEQLPEGCKTVLKLAYFEGLKNDEIATELGVSINTVKTQRQRALNLLRLRLPKGAYLLLLALLPS